MPMDSQIERTRASESGLPNWARCVLAVAFAAGAMGISPRRTIDAEPMVAPVVDPDKAALGKSLFFDGSLSVPAGQSCASCHSAGAGFTFPDPSINLTLGVAPGAVNGRYGFRAVPAVSYAAFNPPGPPHHNHFLGLYVGGQFWDGHADDLTEQAKFPFLNPNEMNNLTHNMGDPSLVVAKVAAGPFADQFRAIFGPDAFVQPTEVVYHNIADAIAEFEKSPEVSPFSSKYDAWRAGKAELTESELNGLRLMTGTWSGRPDGAAFVTNSHCAECHMIPSVPSVGQDIWTSTCYQNIGVPKNADNPFYNQTDAQENPVGYNPEGAAFIDVGLGNTLYPLLFGLPPGNQGPGSNGQGDFLGINGLFKAPSLRNVDLRPYPGFVKAYMHNGALKSVEETVHFYNTRNLTTKPGEVIDFTKADPYAGLQGTPLWPTPEAPSIDTLVNPEGALGTEPGTGPGGESTAQVGNLGLTAQQEADIVAFLRTLSDGYFVPENDPCFSIVSQPVLQKAAIGASVRMTVAASTPFVEYQWRRNGEPILGQTLSFYDIVTATTDDAGLYDCIITADCGSKTTNAAPLLVCPGDLNGDGLVDDADFSIFVVAYDVLDCAVAEMPLGCPSDLNRDGLVDDGDFSVFVGAYDALLCE